MTRREDLLKDLEIKIEAIRFRYVNLFKSSGQELKKFFEDNGRSMRGDLAHESTNTLHLGIMNGVSDPEFAQRVMELNLLGAYNIQEELYNLTQ